ncbi:glycosyltransferase, partial [Paraburkholderia caribensis]|uniref:glycosyltransferase n=1 Tax=Paraburkholderia caribensis TaxID=75105 RepID=UPI0034D303DB
IGAVEDFADDPARFRPADCRANAERFSIRHFRERFFGFVRETVPALQGATLPLDEPPAKVGDQKPVSNALRVLAIDQSGVMGGAELSLLEVVKALRARVQVLLFDDGPFRMALHREGVAVDVLDPGATRDMRKQGGTPPIARAVKSVASLVSATVVRARQSDVIYANTQRAMVIGAIAGRFARRPVVWHLRDIV